MPVSHLTPYDTYIDGSLPSPNAEFLNDWIQDGIVGDIAGALSKRSETIDGTGDADATATPDGQLRIGGAASDADASLKFTDTPAAGPTNLVLLTEAPIYGGAYYRTYTTGDREVLITYNASWTGNVGAEWARDVGGGAVSSLWYVTDANTTIYYANAATWSSWTEVTDFPTAGGITATVGNITATAGNITATAGNITATAGDVIATAGDVSAVAGNVEALAGNVSAGHFVGADSAPSWAAGAALGGDPPAVSGSGTDSAGSITFTADTAGGGSHTNPPASGGLALTCTFSRAYSSTPFVVLQLASNQIDIMNHLYIQVPDATKFEIYATNPTFLSAGVTYTLHYHVIG